MNIRMASPVSEEFQRIQDEYLQEENRSRGFVELSSLTPMQKEIYLWRGDITRLVCGAIVNAANSGMTGCYQPCHNCIDNCIHTYAGIQLRNYCNDLMEKQGHEEPTGTAKITPAFNLPCDYVIHTVGPIVKGNIDTGPPPAACILLSLLPGTGRSESDMQHCVLLYFHRSIYVS